MVGAVVGPTTAPTLPPEAIGHARTEQRREEVGEGTGPASPQGQGTPKSRACASSRKEAAKGPAAHDLADCADRCRPSLSAVRSGLHLRTG